MQAGRILGEDYDIVGAAANGRELLEAVGRLDPDLIVLDISMPEMDGFEAARRLKASGCRSKLVFLTVWEDPDYVREAMGLSACAYVVKSRLASDLKPAVSEAVAGHTFVSPTMQVQIPYAGEKARE